MSKRQAKQILLQIQNRPGSSITHDYENHSETTLRYVSLSDAVETSNVTMENVQSRQKEQEAEVEEEKEKKEGKTKPISTPIIYLLTQIKHKTGV